ncbi:thiamine-phosphate kinase [Candidatus Synechococcus calcipolaris G9]|uniref:Thiamine-monophosphate kinase n=1 Tax=Candidatus Synechococcus calcipolaris G9 TaxID=1497997 RepID=A0ABT6EVA1_9SYNE|nr:thiamine-phosphate kinase [Candidatus Synechococcus calcipolaris]MDG2989723.1 thiamine-phosphate kinase [Candidatus Synechococcus calcipolaris G9]
MGILIKDLGERGLLPILQKFCPPGIVGDDGAVILLDPDRQLVVSTDVLVDGVHLSVGLARPNLITTSGADAGWRAATANLSDLAAMGADPLGITVGLGIPETCPLDLITDLYQGLYDCLQLHRTVIWGGDICRSPVLTLSITALGQASPHQVIYRHRAQVGDLILTSGIHGASRAGLECLSHPEWGQAFPNHCRQTWIRAHQRPRPRLDLLPALRSLPQGTRISGMDSSDGLADAVIQLCQASGVGGQLHRENLPLIPELEPSLALEWGLYGGEDFELVICVDPVAADTLIQTSPFRIIGTIIPQPGVTLETGEGNLTISDHQSFQHFG